MNEENESVYPAPIVRPRTEHCISRRDICPHTLKVLYRLARSGHIAYLVGGSVRDLLLKRQPKDFDVGTDAKPRRIKELFRNCFLIGRRFRLAHINYGDTVIETSTFRAVPEETPDSENPEASLLQRDNNTFGSPAEDARRRDFTVNALFYDIDTFSIIDHVGGLRDLEQKFIRSIGDPDVRFREDPVRMMRAVRFAARLDFDIEEATYAALLRHREEIRKAAPPRMLEEIYKLYGFDSAEASFRLLHRTGLLTILFPELEDYLARRGEDAPLWGHLRALDQGGLPVEEITPPLQLGAVLAHPILESLREIDADGKHRRAMQEDVAERLAPAGERFRVPRRVADRLRRIILAQERFEPTKKRRFSRSRFMAQEIFPEALSLYEMHIRATDGDRAKLQEWLEAYARFQAERAEETPEETAGDDEDKPGRKRRRRGGRRRRSSSGKGEKQAADESTEPETKEAESGNAAETGKRENADEEAGKETPEDAPRKRRRRRKKKKKSAPSDEAEHAGKNEKPNGPHIDLEQPLTAMGVLGTAPPAPEPKTPPRRENESPSKPARKSKSPPGQNDKPEAKPEDDWQPPHWLDEI